ncbi:hypothetical protein V6N12_024695 [Hibiscus sabdariffa]|uniref:FAE domain-containing protein n=1 Tax=Hibiscus sabdariffa TaxID=183260 RepID=A0ABR2BF01_9ROSI
MKEARNETEAVMFGAIDEVLGKTGLKPVDIGIVVVNSSLFNPSPSLAATIVNHYKLRQSVVTYTLGADDRSYSCAFQQEDETNELGVSPLNDLMSVAGEALKASITIHNTRAIGSPRFRTTPVFGDIFLEKSSENEDREAQRAEFQVGIRAFPYSCRRSKCVG